MKKTAVILSSVFMLSIFMSVMVNAADINSALNFNGLATGISLTSADNAAIGLSIANKSNTISVAEFPSATDKSLKIHKTGTDDPFVNSDFASAVTGLLIVDVKVYIEELNTSSSIMFREPSPIFFNAVTFKADGTISSNAKPVEAGEGDNIIGNWNANEWMQVIIKVDLSAKKYTVIINGKTLVDNATIRFENYNSIGLVRFGIASDGTNTAGNGLVYFDDIRTYTNSTEVLSDTYFGVATFVPPVDPEAVKTTTTSADNPATADPITLALVAAAAPVVCIAVNKAKKSKNNK